MNKVTCFISILVVFLLLFSHLNAQVSEEWVRTYNGSGNGQDRANAMVVDGSGNVYVTGSSATSGGNAYVTTKYSSAGAQQWVAIYNGPKDTSSATAIAVDNDGNVYVTGGSTGIGTEGDYATIKYNSFGGEEWVARYDGPVHRNDVASSIAVDGLGNVYVTGYSRGGASVNSNDYVTIKYNSFGDSLWVARYYGPSGGNNYPSAIAVDGDGNVYVTGNSDGTATTLRDYATIKYNSSGVQLWATRYNYPVIGNDYATALAVDGSGNVYVTGASQGNGTSFDYATIKYNKYGFALWYKRYNGPGNSVDYAYALKLDDSGNVYVTGLSHGVGTNNSDYATIKYDPSGNQLWVARYDGPVNGLDAASSLAVDSLGNVYVTGWSAGDAMGHLDYATVKYNSSGEQWWVQRYSGPGNFNDNACSIALDDSGYVYVTGTIGIDSANTDFATIKYTKGGSVYQPRPLAKWISDTTNTIKWSDEGWTSVNIKCILNYGTPQETIDSIAYGVPNSLNEFDWDIPDTILSFRSKIIVENANDTTFYLESGIFRIKPYVLTKVNSDSTYTAYKKEIDQWGFRNFRGDVWPATWWGLFNYQGIDPLTQEQYSQTVGDSAFAKARPDRFPDWQSWVRAFSFNACYYLVVDTPRYREIAVRKWYACSNPWGGSCFGIAASNALAFSYKQEFGNKFPNFPPFVNPISIGSDTNVIKTVSELFCHQYGNPTGVNDSVKYNRITPNATLAEIREMLKEDNPPAKTLSIYNNQGTGGHTILPYAVNRDTAMPEFYYIKVYDNAYPYSNNPVIIYTVANGGGGSWGLADWSTWGGTKNIYLEIPANNYLSNATFTAAQRRRTLLTTTTNRMEVFNSSQSSISFVDNNGNRTGFVNDTIFNEIPGAIPKILKNGSETPPYAYDLPQDRYAVTMSNVKSDIAYAYFFTDYDSYFYERSGAHPDQTDNLEYHDGRLSVSNPDSEKKSIKLSTILTYPDEDYVFTLRSLDLAQHDSVDVDFLQVVSYGSAKHYDVELERAFSWTPLRFICHNIPLPENTTHTYVTDWIDLVNNTMTVLVDIGNDGTIDDTLHLQNLLTDARGHGSLIPTEYKLYQCYPNPFNPSTTIKYDVPKSSHVTLKVFDLLGQEVATLVDDNRNAGTYEVQFDGSKLASGVYFYRLQSESFTEAKKLLLMK